MKKNGGVFLCSRCIAVMKQWKWLFFAAVTGFCLLEGVGSVYATFGMQKFINGLAHRNQQRALQALLQVCAVNVAWWVYMPIGQYWLDQVQNRTMKRLKEEYVSHSIRLPMRYYDNTSTGDLLSGFSNDLSCLADVLHYNLEQLFRKVIGGLTGIVVMFAMQQAFALLVVFMGSISILSTNYFTSRMGRKGEELLQQKSENTCNLYELVKAAKNIRLLKLQKIRQEQMEHLYQEEASISKKAGILMGKQEAFQTGANLLSYLGVIAAGSWFVYRNWSDWGTVVALIGLKGMADMLFLEFPQVCTQLRKNLAGARRIFTVMEEEEWVPQTTDQMEERLNYAIDWSHVTFGYREEQKVLKDFSMVVEKNQLTLLEGKSGSGKSTIAKLMLGFYPVEHGVIRRNYHRIAYVPQEPCLIAGTIRENLTCVKQEATDEQIWEALQKAGADFVERLPDRIDTILLEDGNGLSGGQKQRLALARALLSDAEFLLLDEVTSALDYETAHQFLDTLNQIKNQKTILFITHDLTMETKADAVIRI